MTISTGQVVYAADNKVSSFTAAGDLYLKSSDAWWGGLGVDTTAEENGIDTFAKTAWEDGKLGPNSRLSEICFAKQADGTGVSEAVVFELPEGQSATSLSITLGGFASSDTYGKPEKALISFYNGTTLIKSETVEAKGGSVLALEALNPDSTFTKVMVSAVDNGITYNTYQKDNSDFTIQSVSFGGVQQESPAETVTAISGHVTGVSADGITSIVFDESVTSVTLADGKAMTLATTDDGQTLTGTVDGTTYFTATLNDVDTDGTAQWKVTQTQPFQLVEGQNLLNFVVTDGDGDTAATAVAGSSLGLNVSAPGGRGRCVLCGCARDRRQSRRDRRAGKPLRYGHSQRRAGGGWHSHNQWFRCEAVYQSRRNGWHFYRRKGQHRFHCPTARRRW